MVKSTNFIFETKNLCFLIFVEYKEFLKISHFVYAIYFPYTIVAVRYFHQSEKILIDHIFLKKFKT